jgi:hypothetical protein
MRALLFLAACYAAQGEAAAIASGKHWRISLERIECEAGESLVTIGMRVDYRGPKGPVEAPVSRLVDAQGRAHLPRSLVWTSGSRQLAELVSAGGLRNIQSENTAGIELKFVLRDASGELVLEFGDIRAFPLTRKRSEGCRGLLEPDQVPAPRAARAARAKTTKPAVQVYRSAFPCTAQGAVQMFRAEHPPYVPRQLLVLGRGYLPSARQIELPMGKAAAQSYVYDGADDRGSIEDAALRTAMADFPEYATAKHFAFNWGPQQSQSGNLVYAIGFYDIRACP